MQAKLGQLEEELMDAKKQLTTVEAEKERLIDELREMKEEANLRLSEALLAQTGPQQFREIEKSLVDGSEQLSIESAMKRDQTWQLELEAVKNQHVMDVDALSFALQEIDWVHQELIVTLAAKDAAVKMVENARSVAEANARRVLELSTELESVKESLANSKEQLEIQNTNAEALRIELGEAKKLARVCTRQ